VRGGVYAQRQAADHRQSGSTQGRRERAGIGEPLRRRVAAANDGQAPAVEQLDATAEVEQDRRIGAVEQSLGVVGVGQGEDAPAWFDGPIQRRVYLGACVMGVQRTRGTVADDGGQGAVAGGEDRIGQAEGVEQAALALAAQARDQRQAQPGAQSLCVWVQGLRTRSPGTTGRLTSITRA